MAHNRTIFSWCQLIIIEVLILSNSQVARDSLLTIIGDYCFTRDIFHVTSNVFIQWERMSIATNYLNWYLWMCPPNGTHFEKWEREHDPKQTREGLKDTILQYWSKELRTKVTFTFQTSKTNHPFMTHRLVLELNFHEQRLKIKFDQ